VSAGGGGWGGWGVDTPAACAGCGGGGSSRRAQARRGGAQQQGAAGAMAEAVVAAESRGAAQCRGRTPAAIDQRRGGPTATKGKHVGRVDPVHQVSSLLSKGATLQLRTSLRLDAWSATATVLAKCGRNARRGQQRQDANLTMHQHSVGGANPPNSMTAKGESARWGIPDVRKPPPAPIQGSPTGVVGRHPWTAPPMASGSVRCPGPPHDPCTWERRLGGAPSHTGRQAGAPPTLCCGLRWSTR